MSFSKAKIQRFNDILNNVPSPTKYDPKIGDKVKGGFILKGDPKPASATCTDSAPTSCSKAPAPLVFRTPQLPKKHNCLGISEKGSHSVFKSFSIKSEDHEFLNRDGDLDELKALRAENHKKNETISALEKNIHDLKTQISNQDASKMKLEAYIKELQTAKSNLESIQSNNENYEQQINHFQAELKKMDRKIEELSKTKEELVMKLEEFEKKNNKLEESNLDYERKIISLEGTIEQIELEHKNKEKIIGELKHNEEVYKMNHQVSVECLKGKISTLENEIKEMDSNKSKNEATIFGLETQISNLNCHIEKLKAEKMESEEYTKTLGSQIEKLQAGCKNHIDTITGLEMELENRMKEIQQLKESKSVLKNENDSLKSEIQKEKMAFEEQIKNLNENHQDNLKEIKDRYEEEKRLFDLKEEEFETNRTTLLNNHAKEILQLQNEYESKLLGQMQENTDKINLLQCQIDERDALLKQTNLKYMNLLADWEKKLQEAEKHINKLESEHLETIQEVSENFSKKIRMVEINSSKALEMKNKEIDILTEQYKEILNEINELLKDLEKKDLEIKSVSRNNVNLNSRLKVMLEEIKLLNKENETKTQGLEAMTSKYTEEFRKNERLSTKLGELDGKIVQLKEDLAEKVEDWKRVSEELKKSKNVCSEILNKKLTLETTVSELQEKVRKLTKELDENRESHEKEIKVVSEELAAVKAQCRKFEIVMGNTRKSLEALRERLLESENEVEKLNMEKVELKKELGTVEKEKEELKIKYEDMLETKNDLENTIDECLSNNKALAEKCANLESLCEDFEANIKKLTLVNSDLETEKESSIQAMNNLIKKHELQLIETERETLDQVEKVSQALTEKLEFFMKFSTEKVKNLTTEIKTLKIENEMLNEELKTKSYDYDNVLTDNEILKTTLEVTVKESEDLKRKCEDQTGKLEEMENMILELETDKKSLEENVILKNEEYSKLVEERNELQKKMEEKIMELDSLTKAKIESENQVLHLKSELEKREQDDRDLNLKELEIQKLEIEIESKNTELSVYMHEKMIYVQQIQQLCREKEELTLKIKETERNMAANEKIAEELLRKQSIREEEQLKHKMEFEELVAETHKLEVQILSLQNKYQEEKKLSEELAEKKKFYKDACLKLEQRFAEKEQENKELANDFNEIHEILQEKEKRIEALTKKCANLESLIGPFREQLEQYENERMLIENDREELRKQHLEQAAKLGHQNHKQKIQHVVKLKSNLLETRKENEKLNLEIKNLKKKIQKLQEELGQHPKRLFIGGKRPSALPFKGKENSSPSAGMVTPISIKQEPMSPGSPLRNRNQ